MKKKALAIFCGIVAAAIIGILIWGRNNATTVMSEKYNDGVEQIDINTIYLENSGVEVDFSEVLLGSHEEMRKLIVSTQEATVSTELADKLIQKIDFDFLKKTQKVSYTGTGYFVVDLDNLTKENIVDDKEKKTLTIKIGHAYLQAIEIDPDKIIVDEVKKGLLTWGDIELTVKDYNVIEKELRGRLEEKFNTAENGQEANALEVNLGAADELARQLRLRDMGGIVIIDFIDLHKTANKTALYDEMCKLMATDKAKHTILPLTKFGLMQITRQRVRPLAIEDVSDVCPTCQGSGKVEPTVLLDKKIENQISLLTLDRGHKYIRLVVSPYVAAFLKRGFLSLRRRWEWRYKVKIDIVEDQSMGLIDVHYHDKRDNELIKK